MMNLDIFSFIEFCLYFIGSFIIVLVFIIIITFLIKYKIKIRLIILIAVAISFSFSIYKVFSENHLSDKRYKFIFEEHTKVKLPMSTKFIEVKNINGFNDAIETVTIEIPDSTEYYELKHIIINQKHLLWQQNIKGTGYSFNSEIFKQQKIDSVIVSSKDNFILCFVKKSHRIIFQKQW